MKNFTVGCCRCETSFRDVGNLSLSVIDVVDLKFEILEIDRLRVRLKFEMSTVGVIFWIIKNSQSNIEASFSGFDLLHVCLEESEILV